MVVAAVVVGADDDLNFFLSQQHQLMMRVDFVTCEAVAAVLLPIILFSSQRLILT